MARSRNIKPRFFTNEDLVELPFEARLLFIGLWTEADREGRLEDRPKRLKMSLFPADNIDIDLQLTSLANAGFILRYEANGDRFIQVLNFDKHQSPHVKEVASIIPAPTIAGKNPIEKQQDSGKEDANTVQAPDMPDAEPVLAALIPDCLIPDVLIPDSPSTGLQAATAAKPNTSASIRIADLIALEIPEQLAKDFLSNRKAKKAPLTQTALDGIAREAAQAGITLAVAIRTCTERGWAGFKAEWLSNQRGGKPDIEAQNQAELQAFLGGSRIIDGECSHA